MATVVQLALIAVATIVCTVTMVMGKQCNYYTDCSCVFDDESGMIDLSSLTRTDGLPMFQDQAADYPDTFLYSYNGCGGFTEGTCSDVAVCQFDPYNYLYYDVGDTKKVSFNYDGLNVVAKYTSNDGAKISYVTLLCSGSGGPTISVQGETTPNNYYMTVTAPALCPVSAPEGYGGGGAISGGSVLLIIFFVLIFLYLAIGFSYMKYRRQAEGKEMIPNLSFWTAIPGLIKDGCVFVVAVARRKRSVYVSM